MSKNVQQPSTDPLAHAFVFSQTSRLPKYVQFRAAIMHAIERGEWKPGDRLPAEQEFARSLPLSLGTIQKGLRILADEGVLVRAHGSGTFVAGDRKQMDELQHVLFLNADESDFLPVYSKVTNRKQVAKRGPWSSLLQHTGHNITQIERLLDIGGEFCVFSRFFVNTDRYRSFLTLPLRRLNEINFKQVLRVENSLPITHLSEALRTIPFPVEVTQILNVTPKTVGMFIEATAHAGNDNVLYYQELFIPPTIRKLVVKTRVK